MVLIPTHADVCIIGGGIIGATLSRYFQAVGRSVTLLHDGQPQLGTGASGGHMKQSWSGMNVSQFDGVISTLNDIWEVKEEEFNMLSNGDTSQIYRVDTADVLDWTKTTGLKTTVKKIRDYEFEFPFVDTLAATFKCQLLIVAAGVWCKQLLPDIFPGKNDLVGKMGVSFRWKGTVDPFVKQWAPYKQIVAHQQAEDEIWAGDGSAILTDNWTEDRTVKCQVRCRSALNTGRPITNRLNGPKKTIFGIRPYAKPTPETSDPCFFRKIGPNAYVVTGAGKLGTLAAGWAVQKLQETLE